MTSDDELFSRLLGGVQGALRNLSATAEEQVEYLNDLGVGDSADELALEFDDAFKPFARFIGRGKISKETEDSLDAVDRALADLNRGQPSGIWRLAALASRQEWGNIRRLSSVALERLSAGEDTHKDS